MRGGTDASRLHSPPLRDVVCTVNVDVISSATFQYLDGRGSERFGTDAIGARGVKVVGEFSRVLVSEAELSLGGPSSCNQADLAAGSP